MATIPPPLPPHLRSAPDATTDTEPATPKVSLSVRAVTILLVGSSIVWAVARRTPEPVSPPQAAPHVEASTVVEPCRSDAGCLTFIGGAYLDPFPVRRDTSLSINPPPTPVDAPSAEPAAEPNGKPSREKCERLRRYFDPESLRQVGCE